MPTNEAEVSRWQAIISGGDLFDNPGSSYYNEPIFTK